MNLKNPELPYRRDGLPLPLGGEGWVRGWVQGFNARMFRENLSLDSDLRTLDRALRCRMCLRISFMRGIGL